MKLFAFITAILGFAALRGAEFTSWSKTLPAGVLQIHQIDNPEQIGDIYIVITPDQKISLIDTGVVSTGETVLIPALEKRNIKHIDQLIISHFHSYHAGGAVTLLADPKFTVGKIICTYPPENEIAPGEANSLRFYRTMKMMAARKNIPWIQVVAGDKISFGSGITADVIGGATSKYGIKDHNGQSLVFKLIYKKFTMLFTGDCSFAQEKTMNSALLRADVLKSPHHGGAGSGSEKFVKDVAPAIVVATQPEWLARDPRGIRVEKMLKKLKIPYFRSWEYPDLVIFSDGTSFGLWQK